MLFLIRSLLLVGLTGLFGFVSDEDPFIVDGDGVLEIYEDYIGEIED